jgi:hypothetical protein
MSCKKVNVEIFFGKLVLKILFQHVCDVIMHVDVRRAFQVKIAAQEISFMKFVHAATTQLVGKKKGFKKYYLVFKFKSNA